MPQQLYNFIFLASPYDYTKDGSGAVAPFSYQPWNLPPAFWFEYSTQAVWPSTVESLMVLADRYEQKSSVLLTAVWMASRQELDVILPDEMLLAFHQTNIGNMLESYLGDVQHKQPSILEELVSADVLHAGSKIDGPLIQSDGTTKWKTILYDANANIASHVQSQVIKMKGNDIAGDIPKIFHINRDMRISADVIHRRAAEWSEPLTWGSRIPHPAGHVTPLITWADHGKRPATVIEKQIWALHSYYNAAMTESFADKWQTTIIYRYALLDKNTSRIASRSASQGIHPVELGWGTTTHADVFQAIFSNDPHLLADKQVAPLYEMFHTLESDKKDKQLRQMEMTESGVLNPKPALPTRQQSSLAIALNRLGVKETTVEFQGQRKEVNLLIEKDILAVHPKYIGIALEHYEGHSYIRHGHELEFHPIATNDSALHRPAAPLTDMYAMDVVDAFGPIYQSVGHDDREDLMIVPNRDYPYEVNIDKLYDENGVPYHPLGDASSPSVKVLYPIVHPFPQWAEIANKEIWVNLWPLKDVMLMCTQIWRVNRMKIAGMTMIDALVFLLESLMTMIDFNKKNTDFYPDYLRVFRLVRWYAERAVMNNTDVVLNRTYDQWTDKLAGAGTLNCDGILTGFSIDSGLGLLQSTGPTGTIVLNLTNYVTGQFSFSTKIQGSSTTSFLELAIDGEIVQVIGNDGTPRRLTFDLDPGDHVIQLNWSGAMGDSALCSGFILTGATFKEATTTFNDPETVQGTQAVNSVLVDLMKYYQDHWDQWKNKGSMIINQRKPWIES